MKYQAEVLVIGSGVVGISSAYWLTERGQKVTVVDKGEVCSGSSYGNGGLVVPSHSVPLAAPGVLSKGIKWMFDPESPFFIKLCFDRDLLAWLWKFYRACKQRYVRKAMPVLAQFHLASLRLFEELASLDDLSFGFKKQGVLSVFKSEKGLKEAREESYRMDDIGIESKVLDPIEIQALETNIQPNVIGGLFYPQDAHLIPAKFVQGLARHIEKKGVKILTNTEVIGFETSGSRVTTVKTTRGDFTADEIVLAGGSWSPGIAGDLHFKLPIQPAKGYSISFKRPEKSPLIPFMLEEAKVVVTPMGDTLRFAGTLELTGLDLSINKRRVDAILRSVPKYLPDLLPDRLELIEIWRGLRPCTPDGLPFLVRVNMYDNLTIAAGYAMIGLSLGPITGKLVSQLVSHEEPSIDLTLCKVERFD